MHPFFLQILQDELFSGPNCKRFSGYSTIRSIRRTPLTCLIQKGSVGMWISVEPNKGFKTPSRNGLLSWELNFFFQGSISEGNCLHGISIYIYIYGFFVVGWFCWLPYIAIKSTIFFPPQFPTGSYIRIPGLRRLRKESIVLCQQYLDHWCVSYIALCCKMQFLFFLHDAIAWVCTTKLL